MRKRIPVVTASDIGKAAFCPHAMSLSKQRAGYASPSAESSMENGSILHEDLTDRVMGTRDSRCYVATYAFGESHPTTEKLRSWRDAELIPHWWGRALVKAYYKASPFLVQACRGNPRFGRIVKAIVSRFASSKFN